MCTKTRLLESKVNKDENIDAWISRIKNKLYDYKHTIKLNDSYKLIFCGDGAVGKTCMVRKLQGKTIDAYYKLTIGVQFSSIDIELGEFLQLDALDKKIKLQFWDIAGQTAFRQVRSQFYAGADVTILMVDLSRPITYDIRDWLIELKENTGRRELPVVLVGNKIDLIDKQEAIRLITSLDRSIEVIKNEMAYALDRILFIPTSVTDNINTNKMLQLAVLELIIWQNKPLFNEN